MVVTKEVKNGLCGASCACASLDYPYFIALLNLLIVFVGSLQIRGYGHAVVWLKDFTRSQPCIRRVLLCQLTLVIIIADEFLEVERGFELSHLEV